MFLPELVSCKILFALTIDQIHGNLIMSLPFSIILRRFSASAALRRSFLSPQYKSQALWEERFNCKLLTSDEDLIRTINSKIVINDELNNLEMDVFVNIASPSTEDPDQLIETANILAKFRRSLCAHLMLPSTPHAVCRLFLYSERIPSVVRLLENRVEYGVFPDFYSMNLLIDSALEKDNFMLASRLAVLVMLQEEFSANPITDRLALVAVVNYIQQKTNFEDWLDHESAKDEIFEQVIIDDLAAAQKEEEKDKKSEDDDEEEDDAQYIRVPFLRNPYFDNHFDIKIPRVLCGKTLCAIGKVFTKEEPELAAKCALLGYILQGKWSDAIRICNELEKDSVGIGNMKELLEFYIGSLHGIDEIDEEIKNTLVTCINKLPESGDSLGALVESKFTSVGAFENKDIDGLRKDLVEWSKARLVTKKASEDRLARNKLIEEVRAKKEELKRKEEYLYFYDNLRKSRQTRIEYD